jgi:hypothetical protein
MFSPQMVLQKASDRRDLGLGDGAFEWIEVAAFFQRIEPFGFELESANRANPQDGFFGNDSG